MTTSSLPQQRDRSGHRGAVGTIAIGMVAASAVLGLVVSAVTFLAVAVAFALAVPIAQQYPVSFSASDMAVAGRIAEFWWVFGASSAASLFGALLVAVKTIHHLDSAPRHHRRED